MRKLVAAIMVLAFLAVPAFAASQADAQAAITQAKADIAALAERGISTFAANDLLKEAELQYADGDYNRAAEVAAQISSLKASAVNANALIDEIDARTAQLEKTGADTAQIRGLIAQANEAYGRDDFKGAETHALAALNLIDDAQSKLNLQNTLLATESAALLSFMKTRWKELLAATAIAIVAGSYWWKGYSKKHRQRKIAGLKAKKEMLLKLMKEAQRKHFIEGSTSRNDYLVTMRSCRQQITDAKRQLEMLRKSGERK